MCALLNDGFLEKVGVGAAAANHRELQLLQFVDRDHFTVGDRIFNSFDFNVLEFHVRAPNDELLEKVGVGAAAADHDELELVEFIDRGDFNVGNGLFHRLHFDVLEFHVRSLFVTIG
jgi:hypothetical protein